MNRDLFKQACDRVISEARRAGPSQGIGTLGEKTLHAVLKNYFQPDVASQELRISGYVADIITDSGIIEIQTRNFNALRKKLECFLAQTDVTIVYPIAHTKWLIWIDETTGEITKKRRSPKVGKPYEVFGELYRIKNLLCHPKLRLCLVLLELEEYRYLNGWSRDKKKGSSRYDRIPVDITEELHIRTTDEYDKLIPASLTGDFTSKDFKAASGLSIYAAQTALNVLHAVGAVTRTGKKGNAFVYERRSTHPGQIETAAGTN
jgi:hypothetical protein